MPAVKKKPNAKKPHAARSIIDKNVFSNSDWIIRHGELKAPARKGRPPSVAPADRLFRFLGEKIPFEALCAVRDHVKAQGSSVSGVYVAHDSMGCPRYIGRGAVFGRLAAHQKAHPLELHYFSFYLVEDKKHEREVETLLIRAASFMLHFNERKKPSGIDTGDVRDYEAGTKFYERT